MLRKSLLSLTGAALLFVAHAASAQDSPFYITGSAGAFMRDDFSRAVTIHNSEGLVGPGTNTTTYDVGPDLNLGVGYRLPLGFRIEGELGYANYGTDSTAPLSATFPNLNGNRLGLSSGGSHNLLTTTVNGFYDLPLSGRVVPYVGGGIGYYHDESATAVFPEPNGTYKSNGRYDDNAIVLGEIGASVKITDHWDAVPAYRFDHFFATSGLAFDANIFKLGARYSF